MSLNDEERRIVVRLQLEKAHNTFSQIHCCRKQVIGIMSLIGYIIPFFMQSLLCLFTMDIMLVRIVAR